MNKVDRDERYVKRCKKCGRVVGCDMNGKKHKCYCVSAKILRKGIK
uniref:Uncharacterized protein n=1 Tax=viral metagenome TaxID=1070528 RepID=A0A6M3JFK5_9ZZZZ